MLHLKWSFEIVQGLKTLPASHNAWKCVFVVVCLWIDFLFMQRETVCDFGSLARLECALGMGNGF